MKVCSLLPNIQNYNDVMRIIVCSRVHVNLHVNNLSMLLLTVHERNATLK